MKLDKTKVIEEIRGIAKAYDMKEISCQRDETVWKMWNIMGEFIRHTLAQEDSVKIPGVGIISRKLITDRVGQNPKTGEKVKVPPFYVIKVKSTEDFRHDSI